MEFPQRGMRPNQASGPESAPVSSHTGNSKSKKSGFGWMRASSVVLLFSTAILILALIVFMAFGGKGVKRESAFVDGSKYQAVFLNGGQVYFGKVTSLNPSYMTMSDIYYLRVNQTVQPEQEGNNQQAANDVQLVKLGCELHGPQDTMVINRDMVIFWENLKDDGQVAEAVATYKQQNPQGQNCDTQNQNTNTEPADNDN